MSMKRLRDLPAPLSAPSFCSDGGLSCSAILRNCSTSTPAPKAAIARALSSEYIFSTPSARATSYMPDETYSQATWRAVLELAQAFSVLIMGILSMPISRRITCARMHSWPVMRPAAALPTMAIWRSFFSIPAAPSAASTASRLSSFSPLSGYLPKRVIPAPTMATSLIFLSRPALCDTFACDGVDGQPVSLAGAEAAGVYFGTDHLQFVIGGRLHHFQLIGDERPGLHPRQHLVGRRPG